MLSAEERAELVRARIILACAEGASNSGVTADFGVSTETVRKWRSRFVARRVAGLVDEPRSGRRKPELVLSEAERSELTRWARRAKRAPALTRATRWGALTALHRACADSTSLNTMARAAAREPAPRLACQRCRIHASLYMSLTSGALAGLAALRLE
ncbi:hypothetical protein GCM10022384_33050 [Streptomyces marokkonensis]|uniref:Transposase n=1 Tax=Streptomyces marokkonensis TaxID=324855 RepID=A0ABP7QEL6_9ACTN